MKKVLIAVDSTKSSKAVLSTFFNSVQHPEVVILMHVERLQGRSLMIDMLGDAELNTLRDSLKGTEYKEILDKKAEELLEHYRKELEENGSFQVKTIIRDGIPSEEILKVANEECAELIILGYSGKKGLSRYITGSVSKDVTKNTNIPVLVARKPNLCEEPYSWKDAVTAISVTSIIVLGLVLLEKFVLHG